MSSAIIIDTTKPEGRAAVLAFFDRMAGPRRTDEEIIAGARSAIALNETLLKTARPDTAFGLRVVIRDKRALIAAAEARIARRAA